MMDEKNKITPAQLMFITTQAQVGYGVLALPHQVFSVAKADGWISTFISGIVIQLIILVIWAVGRRFPNLTVYEILPRVFGKVLGKTVHVAYIVYFILTGVSTIVNFGSIIGKWMFSNTPSWAVYVLMLGVCMYLAREGLRTIARFFVCVTSLIVIMIAIAAWAYTKANLLYILPIGQAGLLDIVKGAYQVTVAMIGFEFLLVIYPYVEGGSKAVLKAASIGNGITTLLYVFMVFTSFVFFSPNEMELVPEPVLYMLRAFTFQLIERPDLYFLSIWMVMVSTSLIGNLYLASKGLIRLFGGNKHRKAIPYIAFLVFVVAMFMKDPFKIEAFTGWISIISYLFTLVIPLVILGISVAFRIGQTGVNRT